MKSLESEIRMLIADATNLPADNVIYRKGDIYSIHAPQTKARMEQVRVARYGVVFRSRWNGRKWMPVEQISGSIDE
jgi:hypothetical protein